MGIREKINDKPVLGAAIAVVAVLAVSVHHQWKAGGEIFGANQQWRAPGKKTRWRLDHGFRPAGGGDPRCEGRERQPAGAAVPCQ
jgi:hypothetical protein